MARAIFDYTITVLKKVSFNKDLFCKEVEKAVNVLLPHEVHELIIWLREYTRNKPELHTCIALIK